MARRRLLFVTDVTPLPLDQGQRVRVANLLAGCSRDFDVTLVGPPPEDQADRAKVEEAYESVVWLGSVVPEGAWARLVNWWRSLLAAPGVRRPDSVRRFRPLIAALDTLDLSSYDLIWAERPHVARAVVAQSARTVIDLDDIEHRRMSRAAAFEAPTGIAGRLAASYRVALYRWIELSWSRRFLATIVCSEEDRHYLASHGVDNAMVIPNGINENSAPAGVTVRQRDASSPLRLVFLGNLAHPPNLDAIDCFVGNILPRLRAADPGVQFDVIGPGASTEIRERFSGSANFLGFVANLAEALYRYDMLVAPIRYGGGTRVKLLDAMACAIPIVSTAPGAEGLPVVDGEHMLLADEPEQFARKVLELKRDPELGAQLARNGLALIDRHFRSASIQEEVVRCLRILQERL